MFNDNRLGESSGKKPFRIDLLLQGLLAASADPLRRSRRFPNLARPTRVQQVRGAGFVSERDGFCSGDIPVPPINRVKEVGRDRRAHPPRETWQQRRKTI